MTERRHSDGGGNRGALLLLLVLIAATGVVILVTRGDGDPGDGPEASPTATGPSILPEVVDAGVRMGLPGRTSSWGIAGGDLTDDGRPDLVISYHRVIRVYESTGSGFRVAFRPKLGDPHHCLIADVNRDGLGDVYCTRGGGARKEPGFTKSNGIWIQGPEGTFSENLAPDFGLADPAGRGRRATFIHLDGDPLPDLFVGNQGDREDGRPSPNRTYLNDGGEAFTEVDLGITREDGADCAEAVDVDVDGREDLLVCGTDRLLLFRNERGPDGGPALRDVTREWGLPRRGVRSAAIADLDQDGWMDAAIMQEDRLRVLSGNARGFGRVVVDRGLEKGAWVEVGDLDGRRGPDLLVVQGCEDDRNVDDMLLMNDGRGGFRPAPVPGAGGGCGDQAEALDVDGDGREEFVVTNGRVEGVEGPVQVLTRSPALAP